MIVVAGDDDQVTVGVDARDDADMAAAAPAHHRDGAYFRPVHARAVMLVAERQVAAAFVAGLAQLAVVLASLAAAARPRVLRFAIGCASRNNVTPVSIPA
jgi:hypothetical protein